MNEEAKQTGASALDTTKLVVAIVFVIGGIAAFYLLAGQPDYVRWLAVAAGVVLGVVVFATSQYGRDVWQFALDSRIELRKVVWPTRQETLTTTMVVFGFVVVASLFFWVLDLGLAWATRALTGQGG